jgi:hypothetical protein
MNIIQAVKYMMQVLIPSVTPVAGEGIMVAKEKEGSVISATFPGWVPHDMVYVANATNAAWTAGTVILLGASAVSDPEEDTLAATIPTAGADGQFAVIADDVAASSDGLAAVTGLAVAKMSAGFTEAFAVPDGLGGLAGAASGPFRVIYASQSAGEALVAFAGGGGGGDVSDYYKGYFKLSVVEKTRQVENPDYDPEDPDSEEYITETYYEAHHSGGRYAVNGQVSYIQGGDVSGDLSSTLQDVILHFHSNGGIEDPTPTGVSVELAPLGSNSLTDSYWLIGQASVDGVIQQSHGVPSLLWLGCEDEETATPEPTEEE